MFARFCRVAYVRKAPISRPQCPTRPTVQMSFMDDSYHARGQIEQAILTSSSGGIGGTGIYCSTSWSVRLKQSFCWDSEQNSVIPAGRHSGYYSHKGPDITFKAVGCIPGCVFYSFVSISLWSCLNPLFALITRSQAKAVAGVAASKRENAVSDGVVSRDLDFEGLPMRIWSWNLAPINLSEWAIYLPNFVILARW